MLLTLFMIEFRKMIIEDNMLKRVIEDTEIWDILMDMVMFMDRIEKIQYSLKKIELGEPFQP